MTKAKEIAKEMNITNHKCSDDWLQGFLRRHDLHYKKCRGEKRSADLDAALGSGVNFRGNDDASSSG